IGCEKVSIPASQPPRRPRDPPHGAGRGPQLVRRPASSAGAVRYHLDRPAGTVPPRRPSPMSAPSTPAPRPPAAESLESVFLSVVLPRVLSHAEVIFPGIRCPHLREECLAEAIALSWLWCLRLAAQGRDVARFPTALATYAAKAVKTGRRLT